MDDGGGPGSYNPRDADVPDAGGADAGAGGEVSDEGLREQAARQLQRAAAAAASAASVTEQDRANIALQTAINFYNAVSGGSGGLSPEELTLRRDDLTLREQQAEGDGAAGEDGSDRGGGAG